MKKIASNSAEFRHSETDKIQSQNDGTAGIFHTSTAQREPERLTPSTTKDHTLGKKVEKKCPTAKGQ